MTNERMIELLKAEHQCLNRNMTERCDRNCAECDLVQDDKELNEMYVHVINKMKKFVPKKVFETAKYNFENGTGMCPSCGTPLQRKMGNYCTWCGQEVKWTE